MNKNELTTYGAYALLGLVLISGSVFLWNSQSTINEKVEEVEEAERPAEISMVLIEPTQCDVCISVLQMSEYIEGQNIRITSSEALSSESEDGLAIIDEYQISTLPAIIIQGEHEKENVKEFFDSLGGSVANEALVWQMDDPVYFDLASDSIVGQVDLTYITYTDCGGCYDAVTRHKLVLESNFGISVGEETSINYYSSEAQALINKYNITQIPTVILSSDANAYQQLTSAWENVGTIEEDGVYVFRNNGALSSATYYDLEIGRLVEPETTNE